MEAMGEWAGMYPCPTEESDFLTHFLASYDNHGGAVSGDHHGTAGAVSGGFWNVGPHELSLNVKTASFYGSMDASFCSFSQESSSYSASHNGYYAVANAVARAENNDGSSMGGGFGMDQEATINTNSYLVGEETSDCNGNVEKSCGGGGHLSLETAVESQDEDLRPEISVTTDQKSLGHSESSKKRSRPAASDKNKRSTKARRNQKSNNNDEGGEEDENKGKSKAALKRQNSSTTCCSEDESNGGSHDASTALNLNGKARASRGAATDPQSLYARKRRERINERLRILQNLVPNGTKVDISTMLEEAVQYVKFLQLQIKLLSSDDMWMYAPIAYNGMDIGLDLKLNTQR